MEKNKQIEENGNEKIKPMTKTELADAYNISLLKLKTWLQPFTDKIGAYRGKCYTPKQVKVIFDCLGEP